MKKKIKNAKIEEAVSESKEKKKIEKKEREKAEIKHQERVEKTNKVLDEIKAFLILALIIGTIVFGCWYWFKHIYNGERPADSLKEEKKVSGYKTIKYTAAKDHSIDMINEKYIFEFNDNTLYKIMDRKSDTLYEGEIEFDYVREGINGELYVVKVEDAENENVIHIYKLEDNKLKEEKVLAEQGVYFTPIYYYEDRYEDNTLLLGFKGFKDTYDEEFKEIAETYLYTLKDSKMNKIEGLLLQGDSNIAKEDVNNIVTFNSKYIVVREFVNGARTNNYGLYDIEDNKIFIKPQYEGLYTDENDTYIAIKNGKAGIINNKLKKIVDFEYDFIDKNDGYYVVSKNNKMAIMDNEYKLVSKFDFDYQKSSEDISYNYSLSSETYNTFKTSKINNRYVLTINNREYQSQIDYDKHETYIINSDGTYKTIVANEFVADNNTSLIYSFDKSKKVYTFYDQEFNEKCSIDISGYDYNNRALVDLVNENTIRFWFDSNVYFDYETGEEIDSLKDYSALVNGIAIDYVDAKKEVSYSIDGSVVATIDVKDVDDEQFFKINDDSSLFYLTQNEYVYIEKGE